MQYIVFWKIIQMSSDLWVLIIKYSQIRLNHWVNTVHYTVSSNHEIFSNKIKSLREHCTLYTVSSNHEIFSNKIKTLREHCT